MSKRKDWFGTSHTRGDMESDKRSLPSSAHVPLKTLVGSMETLAYFGVEVCASNTEILQKFASDKSQNMRLEPKTSIGLQPLSKDKRLSCFFC